MTLQDFVMKGGLTLTLPNDPCECYSNFIQLLFYRET